MEELDTLVQQGKDHIDSTAEGTLISIVLDQSGSMQAVVKETIDGFNKLIFDQKKEPGKAWVTLTLFDTNVTVVYTAKPIDEVKPLDNSTYKPSGGTALLDAQGITIQRTKEWMESLPENERPGNVLFVTMTDGGENSSVDFSAEDVKKLIDAHQEADEWDFAYTGANQDSFRVAAAMGIRGGFTSNYAGTAEGTSKSFAGMSNSISSYRSASAQGVKTENFFDPTQSKATGQPGEFDSPKKPVDPKPKPRARKKQ